MRSPVRPTREPDYTYKHEESGNMAHYWFIEMIKEEYPGKEWAAMHRLLIIDGNLCREHLYPDSDHILQVIEVCAAYNEWKQCMEQGIEDIVFNEVGIK